MVKYSFVILTYNRPEHFSKCVMSVANAIRKGDGVSEVIVVDNGGVDPRTLEFVKGYVHGADAAMAYIKLEKNEGVVARNYGFEIANGAYVVQVDDDVVVSDNLLPVLNEHLDANTAVGPMGHFAFHDLHEPIARLRANPGEYCDLLMGYCWAFPNRGLSYDTDFGLHWHEETDLQLNMKCCDGSVATHNSAKPPGPFMHELQRENHRRIVQRWVGQDVPWEDPDETVERKPVFAD